MESQQMLCFLQFAEKEMFEIMESLNGMCHVTVPKTMLFDYNWYVQSNKNKNYKIYLIWVILWIYVKSFMRVYSLSALFKIFIVLDMDLT